MPVNITDMESPPSTGTDTMGYKRELPKTLGMMSILGLYVVVHLHGRI